MKTLYKTLVVALIILLVPTVYADDNQQNVIEMQSYNISHQVTFSSPRGDIAFLGAVVKGPKLYVIIKVIDQGQGMWIQVITTRSIQETIHVPDTGQRLQTQIVVYDPTKYIEGQEDAISSPETLVRKYILGSTPVKINAKLVNRYEAAISPAMSSYKAECMAMTISDPGVPSISFVKLKWSGGIANQKKTLSVTCLGEKVISAKSTNVATTGAEQTFECLTMKTEGNYSYQNNKGEDVGFLTPEGEALIDTLQRATRTCQNLAEGMTTLTEKGHMFLDKTSRKNLEGSVMVPFCGTPHLPGDEFDVIDVDAEDVINFDEETNSNQKDNNE